MGMEFRLLTGDPRRLADFCLEHLDFTERVAAGDDIYIELERDGSVLGIYRHDLMEAVIGQSIPQQGGFVVVVDVSDVDAAFERLKTAGIDAVAPPKDQPDWGMRTAYVRDPDGNLFELYSTLGRGE